MPELQVADFVAWILRRDLLETEVWMREVKPTLAPRDYKQWSESLDNWLVSQSDQLFEYPERILPTWTWNRLALAKCKTFYHFDQERLETHILNGRLASPPADLVERSIQIAGRRYPLSP